MLRNLFGCLLFTIVFLQISCENKKGKFIKLASTDTHITFNNTITESDSINIFDFANVYNGGGVGVGDFNNDGLQDVYFTGNMTFNKLYLNKGNMQFEDITQPSNTTGDSVWNRGVAVVDINNDGKLDMYVCATAKRDPQKRKNILYVNEGVNANGIPVFKNKADEYGLADTTQSTMAYFFDYDNDNDLDLYIAVNHIVQDEYANTFKKRNLNGEHPSTGKLYRNDFNDSLKHAYYTDVSKQAGILIEGYTHAANIFDVNNDGWLDILETNDYISNNVLYINQHDGTFKDSVAQYFKHTAANAMGSDAIDINNDGLDDVIEVDMAAQDNYRKKMFQAPSSYQTYQNSDMFGYQYQYVRNMVQLNQGPTIGALDSMQHPIFSEVGFLCNIAETDWSWTPLVADYDNDGNKDIIFTNGFPKDITDRDFITYRTNARNLTSKKDMLAEIPEVKIHNYVYKNNGNLSFTDNTNVWGLQEPTFSNGAAYADLDNDGDLDILINNINDEASVYQNNIYKKGDAQANYIHFNFKKDKENIHGLGAKVQLLFKDGSQQILTNNPYRGYISSLQPGVHFGTASHTIIDTVLITWPDRKQQQLLQVNANQTITIDYNNAKQVQQNSTTSIIANTLFTNISNVVQLNNVHVEDDFVDFNIQKLIPHKLSDLGPGLAVGDINNDGLQDMILGGSLGYSTKIITQLPTGLFKESLLTPTANRNNKYWHDMGLLLFDADNDNDLDLYIAAGGNENEANTANYADKFYLNNGKGNFTLDTSAIPINYASKSCVRAVDYDKDGDVDILVAGRCVPWMYPTAASCFLYRNDSKNGRIAFTDVTATIAKPLLNIGLTCDVVFSDYDNDGWQDIVLAGEFMPIQFIKNNNGVFALTTTGLQNETGWWNSITPADVDNDGDMDYIVGNNGKNSFYRPSANYPVRVYAKDFDYNKSYDALMSTYLLASQKDTSIKEYPAQTRDDLIKQMLEMRNKFKTYNQLANSTFDKLLNAEQLNGALILSASNFNSSIILNDGNGKFKITPLPLPAQYSAVFGMLAEDVNDDGNIDVIISGNDYGTEVSVGRNDALNGLVLLGKGDGTFTPLSIFQSGIYLPGNCKALVKMMYKNTSIVVSSQNRGALNTFRIKSNLKAIPVQPTDVAAFILLNNGKLRKEELYFGSGYLSQSGRFININSQVKSVELMDIKGIKRKLAL